jgi:SPP1 family predicted phage head-tail adaptor
MPSLSPAGQRNRRVTIERATDVDDGQGGAVRSWAALGSAWVKATQVAAKEGLVSGVLRSSSSWRIEMRFRDDLTVEDRLRANWLPAGQVLGISSAVDPDGRRAALILFGETEPE